MKADDIDLSPLIVLLLVLCLQGCIIAGSLDRIDKKLDVLIEQGKPVKESKP